MKKVRSKMYIASLYSSFNYLKDTLKITDQQFSVYMPQFKYSIKKYIKI